MTTIVRPTTSCEVGCHRGWIECGGIEGDSTKPWVQMCDNCASDGTADDDLAASWAQQDTGLAIGLAQAAPYGRPEGPRRPYLIGGLWHLSGKSGVECFRCGGSGHLVVAYEGFIPQIKHCSECEGSGEKKEI